MNKLLSLYTVFFKIGAFTFGGGYAMLPMLERELVDKRGWVTHDDLIDYFAIGQCTPGIIAVNTASFIGYKHAGVAGCIAATLGVVSPSVVIITLIAAFLQNFAELEIVRHAFAGIRVCVCVLIFRSVYSLGKSSLKNRRSWIIFGVVLLLALFTPIPTALLVIAAAAVGLVTVLLQRGKA